MLSIKNDGTSETKYFKDIYFVDNQLGSGAFSVVKKCRQKITNKAFAVKIIDVEKTKSEKLTELEEEAKICGLLNHTNIVRYYNCFPEEKNYYFVFELLTGGELFENIVERDFYCEVDASRCIQQIFEAVEHCHSRGVIHRDLKPENLLLENKSPNARVKLTDFGLAVKLVDENLHWHGLAGTPCYIAPEVITRQPFGKAVDAWGCGCILYILLVGFPPFWDSDQSMLNEKIKYGLYDFDSHHWENTSFEAKNLIRKLLTVNPKKRLTISEGLNHQWVKRRDKIAFHKHKQSTVDSLRAFNARRKFKSAIHTTIMATSKALMKQSPNSSPSAEPKFPHLTLNA